MPYQLPSVAVFINKDLLQYLYFHCNTSHYDYYVHLYVEYKMLHIVSVYNIITDELQSIP